MKKHRFAVCCSLVLSALILLQGVPVWAQEGQGRPESPPDVMPPMEEAEALPESPEETTGELMVPTPPLALETDEEGVIRYTVQKGDTLWDITHSIWQDSFLWPKVWRNNIYIINPDLIYPGNILIFPLEPPEPLEEVRAPEPPPPPVEETFAPVEEPPVIIEEPPPPEVVEELPPEPPVEVPEEPEFATLAAGGFILFGHESKGRIVSGRDGRELIGDNELAYIRADSDSEMMVGDRMILTRTVRKVYHPKTHQYMGDLIYVLGVAELIEVEEEIKTVRVVDVFDYITVDDFAIPYEELESNVSSPQEVPFEGDSGENTGYILDVKEAHITNAHPDIVYLDKGLRDGLEKGNRFDVIRHSQEDPNIEILPPRIIGQVEVLMVLDVTSTARVMKSSEPIAKGDVFEPPPSP